MLAVLAICVCGAAALGADPHIRLVGPIGPVPLGTDFDVPVEITSDTNLAMIQVVLDGLDPSLELIGIDAPLAGTSFVNGSLDTAVMDFFPGTYSAPTPSIVATLTFSTSVAGDFPLDLFLQNGSSFSTAVFDSF